ncbi:hypothetical protein F0243_27460 [Vibrio mediterranei]|nr:hypothetical protein [Vibrio mediterranei]
MVKPNTIIIYGKKIGTTQLSILDMHGNTKLSAKINVTLDKSLFISEVKKIAPKAKIDVNYSADGKLFITGIVDSELKKQMICNKAYFLLGKEEVKTERSDDIVKNTLNLNNQKSKISCSIKTSESHELINLSVKMIDVNVHLINNLGIDWSELGKGPGIYQVVLGKKLNFPSAAGLVNAMLESNQTKLLAEPNISVLAGREAQFKAGGELPVITVDKNGNHTVTFKPYGVKLRMSADVSDSGAIKIGIHSKVSRVDISNSYEINDAKFPALSSQSATTTLEVNDGDSFILGGLSSYNTENKDKGIPILSHIPIISSLFNHVSDDLENRQIIIVATVHTIHSQKEEKIDIPRIEKSYSFTYRLLGIQGYKKENIVKSEIGSVKDIGLEFY